jgi:hypothetical protein
MRAVGPAGAIADRLTVWLVLSLCQIAAVSARMRVSTWAMMPSGVRPPGWPQVQLSFQGPVHRFEELEQRFEKLLPGPGRLVFADRAQQRQLTLGEFFLEGPAEVVLVPDQRLPLAAIMRSAAFSSISSRTSRSSAFAPGRANMTGSPCRVQTRCNRRPSFGKNRTARDDRLPAVSTRCLRQEYGVRDGCRSGWCGWWRQSGGAPG